MQLAQQGLLSGLPGSQLEVVSHWARLHILRPPFSHPWPGDRAVQPVSEERMPSRAEGSRRLALGDACLWERVAIFSVASDPSQSPPWVSLIPVALKPGKALWAASGHPEEELRSRAAEAVAEGDA